MQLYSWHIYISGITLRSSGFLGKHLLMELFLFNSMFKFDTNESGNFLINLQSPHVNSFHWIGDSMQSPTPLFGGYMIGSGDMVSVTVLLCDRVLPHFP